MFAMVRTATLVSIGSAYDGLPHDRFPVDVTPTLTTVHVK